MTFCFWSVPEKRQRFFPLLGGEGGFRSPVIFLTLRGMSSAWSGLELGAEDYVSKPFRPRELISRIRSVLRRCGKSQAVLEIEDLRWIRCGPQ